MFNSLISIGIGAVLGAWLRWFLGMRFNSLYPDIPLGTVIANLGGAYIIGVALSFFATSSLSPSYRLLIITGFCGALTTFSTFSAEIVTLLQNDKYSLAILSIAVHLLGSFLFTSLGIISYQWVSHQ